MNQKTLMARPWMRIVVFLWLIVFPIVFIALPGLEMILGEQEKSWTPVWGLIIWMLGPWAGSILLKWFGGLTSKMYNPYLSDSTYVATKLNDWFSTLSGKPISELLTDQTSFNNGRGKTIRNIWDGFFASVIKGHSRKSTLLERKRLYFSIHNRFKPQAPRAAANKFLTQYIGFDYPYYIQETEYWPDCICITLATKLDKQIKDPGYDYSVPFFFCYLILIDQKLFVNGKFISDYNQNQNEKNLAEIVFNALVQNKWLTVDSEQRLSLITPEKIKENYFENKGLVENARN